MPPTLCPSHSLPPSQNEMLHSKVESIESEYKGQLAQAQEQIIALQRYIHNRTLLPQLHIDLFQYSSTLKSSNLSYPTALIHC